MKQSDLISKFYTSFSEGNVEGMLSCYHKDIEFTDPAFGLLKGDRACNMWKMLLSQKKTKVKVDFFDVETENNYGSAKWTASYLYGNQQRKVVNKVKADFVFKDGLIISHNDVFDLWIWTQQALGFIGYLLGWSGFMKSKIQKQTNVKLDKFINQNI